MEDLNKSIDEMIDLLFPEEVKKANENFEVANASKTTSDASVASAPKSQNDEARGAGRPKQISDVPDNDEDGKRDGQYDASISGNQSEEEPEETKKQIKAIDQTSSQGHSSKEPKMKDPRLSKSVSEEEYAEYQAFKKAETDKKEQEQLKKTEDLKKAEFETLIKSAITSALEPVKKENEVLRKSLNESQAILKAMAGQPQRSKSVTGIEALEKSSPESSGPQEFSKKDKLDAAESLVMKKSIPLDAVIELENTGTVYNPEWRRLIERELEKQN